MVGGPDNGGTGTELCEDEMLLLLPEDKVSGLKSILRVVLPASAGPKSDLICDAVSGSDLIFLKNHATSTASALPDHPSQEARVTFHP